MFKDDDAIMVFTQFQKIKISGSKPEDTQVLKIKWALKKL